ncbi:hypothetical protein ACFSFY_01800 [Sporosarcina siberiensis]|uniref:Uncharacterized protein n=1 Tax=Sporosarcina siberiensis TaxID=1365606 RepID=A0ABW4SBE9_9BACL
MNGYNNQRAYIHGSFTVKVYSLPHIFGPEISRCARACHKWLNPSQRLMLPEVPVTASSKGAEVWFHTSPNPNGAESKVLATKIQNNIVRNAKMANITNDTLIFGNHEFKLSGSSSFYKPLWELVKATLLAIARSEYSFLRRNAYLAVSILTRLLKDTSEQHRLSSNINNIKTAFLQSW